VLLVSAGEAAGFLVPVGVVLAGAGSGGAGLAVLLAAGAAEGALLGAAQAAVLHRVLAGFSRRDWVLRTAAAAVLAWALGMAPSTWATAILRWPVAVQAVLSVVGAGVLLASIGVAQWTVLRRSVPRAGRWIAWTAAGWLAGLAVFTAVTTTLWRPGQSPGLVAAVGVLGGALMALSMAAVTGRGVLDLLPRGGRA
jgi:Ca2+-transporting ATPase